MYKFIFIFIIFFLKISFANSCVLLDKIDVIIDNDIILNSNVNFEYKICKIEKPYLIENFNEIKLKEIILNKLIIKKLVYKIFYEDLNLSNTDIDNYINKISKNLLLDKNEFLNYLSFNNLNLNDYNNFIKNKIIVKKIIKKKIYPLLNVSEKEINDCLKNINNNFIKNLFLIYDIDIIKITDKFDKDNLNIINILKEKINILFKKKNSIIENIKINDNFYIKEISIKNINLFYKNLPNIIICNINKDNYNNIIGPIFNSNNIYFLKINSIKKINENKLFINKVCLKHIILNNKINNLNSNEEIDYFYNKLVNNKSLLDKKHSNNIEIKNLGWISINNFDKYIKNKIISLKKNEFSKPFKYNNKWNILYIEDSESINHQEYIEKLWIKKFILKNKLFYFLDKTINEFNKEIYIKIIKD